MYSTTSYDLSFVESCAAAVVPPSFLVVLNFWMMSLIFAPVSVSASVSVPAAAPCPVVVSVSPFSEGDVPVQPHMLHQF